MIPTSTQMKISLAARPASNWQALVVFVTQGAKAAEGAAAAAVGGEPAGRAAAPLLYAAAATGKANEVVFELVGDRRVYVVGLGPREKMTTETLRQSAAAAAKRLAKHKMA